MRNFRPQRDLLPTAEHRLVRMVLCYYARAGEAGRGGHGNARDTYRCARHPLVAGDGQLVHPGRIHSHPARGGDCHSVAESYPGTASGVTGNTRHNLT